MTVLVLGSGIFLCAMLGVLTVNLITARRLHDVPSASAGPRVSVLVPARDEARNLARLLPAIRNSRYAGLEVLVLDDGSRDDTAAVVESHAAADGRVRLIPGLEPPPGWTGKNWACHQLAHHATGEILVFCDADVVPGPDAVGRTVTILTDGGGGREADVVTAFPRHEPGGWFEEAVVPMLTRVPIAALLPLALVRATARPSLAVGNGQWLGWRRSSYTALGRHALVRDDVLEDVRLARSAKAAGLRVEAVVAPRDLWVRMYRSAGETWAGFAKNAYPLAGGTDRRFLPVVAIFTATMLAPLLIPAVRPLDPVAWIPLALLVVLRAGCAVLFGDRARTILLHPVGAVAALSVALDSRRRHRRGTVVWKQRVVRPMETS